MTKRIGKLHLNRESVRCLIAAPRAGLPGDDGAQLISSPEPCVSLYCTGHTQYCTM